MPWRERIGRLERAARLPHRWHKRRDHAALTNSWAISLFTRCTVPLPTPTSAATFSMPLPALRCVLMAASTLGEPWVGRAACPPGARDSGRR